MAADQAGAVTGQFCQASGEHLSQIICLQLAVITAQDNRGQSRKGLMTGNKNIRQGVKGGNPAKTKRIRNML